MSIQVCPKGELRMTFDLHGRIGHCGMTFDGKPTDLAMFAAMLRSFASQVELHAKCIDERGWPTEPNPPRCRVCTQREEFMPKLAKVGDKCQECHDRGDE